jgi:hypothetical protein
LDVVITVVYRPFCAQSVTPWRDFLASVAAAFRWRR